MSSPADFYAKEFLRLYESRYGQPYPYTNPPRHSYAKMLVVFYPTFAMESYEEIMDYLGSVSSSDYPLLEEGLYDPIGEYGAIEVYNELVKDTPGSVPEDEARYTSDLLVHHYSLYDIPADEMYPSSMRNKRQVLLAMNRNPTYMLRFFEDPSIRPSTVFVVTATMAERVFRNSKASKDHPSYPRFWNACREYFSRSTYDHIRQAAEAMPKYEDTEARETFKKSLMKSKYIDFFKDVIFLSRRKEKWAESFNGIVQATNPRPDDHVAAVASEVMLAEAFNDLCEVPMKDRYLHPLRSCFIEG